MSTPIYVPSKINCAAKKIFVLLGEVRVGGWGRASKQNIMCMLLSIFRQGEGGGWVGQGKQATQDKQAREPRRKFSSPSLYNVLSVLCVLCRAVCRFPRWSARQAQPALSSQLS